MIGAPQDPRQNYLQELGKAHGFSLEQLAMNRQGQVHPAQVARGRSSGFGCAIFAVLLGLLFAAGGIGGALLLYDDYAQPISDTDMNGIYALGGGGILLGVVCFVGALIGFLKVGQRRRAYASGRVMIAEGPLGKVHIEGRGGVQSQWRYSVGGVTFPVSSGAWELVVHGAHYRAYHLTGDLLSIEPL